MYTGSSGIWDSVWAECVHAAGFVASTNFQSQLGKNGSTAYRNICVTQKNSR
jgi:hypothetical protein